MKIWSLFLNGINMNPLVKDKVLDLLWNVYSNSIFIFLIPKADILFWMIRYKWVTSMTWDQSKTFGEYSEAVFIVEFLRTFCEWNQNSGAWGLNIRLSTFKTESKMGICYCNVGREIKTWLCKNGYRIGQLQFWFKSIRTINRFWR